MEIEIEMKIEKFSEPWWLGELNLINSYDQPLGQHASAIDILGVSFIS